MKKERWYIQYLPSALVFGCVFLLMLLCNALTLYAVDDFAYMYSFATKERMDSVLDIIPSMAAHARTMNGRLVAHTLAQLTLMGPDWLFDIVNSLVFCLLVRSVANITGQKKTSWYMYIGVFCALWMFVPAFGQVMLWQDGAVNYLWAAVVGICFLRPFIIGFMNGDSPEKKQKPIFRLGGLLLSFAAGAYSESISAAVIFMAAVLVILDTAMNRRRLNGYRILATAIAFVGYVTIYLAPAQWLNKSGDNFSLGGLVYGCIDITFMYESYLPLLILSAVLLTVNILKKSDPKKIALAITLILGAMAAHYIMVFAQAYPERCALGMVVFHIAANVVLIEAISWDEGYRIKNACVIAVLIMMTLPHLLTGVFGVGLTYRDMRANEKMIQESVANGNPHVEIPLIHPINKYSVLYGAKYLDAEDAHSWPNNSMAKYYGAETILGIPRE